MCPRRSVSVLTAGSLATRDSARRDHVVDPDEACMSTLSGAESALVAGLDPRVARSTDPDPKPCTTSAPESNLIQVTVTFGRQASIQPLSLTSRLTLGIACQPIRTDPVAALLTSTGHFAAPLAAFAHASASRAVVQPLRERPWPRPWRRPPAPSQDGGGDS